MVVNAVWEGAPELGGAAEGGLLIKTASECEKGKGELEKRGWRELMVEPLLSMQEDLGSRGYSS